MDEIIQHQLIQACIAPLQKDVRNFQRAEAYTDRRSPTTKSEAIALLLAASTDPDITVNHITNALCLIFRRSRSESQTRRWVLQLLLELGRQEEIIASDALEIATALYVLSPQDSSERQEAIKRLLALARRRDIPFGDTVEAAHSLCIQSPRGSKERQQAINMLLAQARWPDTTVAQAQEAALALCYASPLRSKERNQAIQALIELTWRPNLSYEDAVVLDYQRCSVDGSKALLHQQWAAKKRMWETIAVQGELTHEQREQVDKALEDYQWFLKGFKQ